MKMSGIYKIQSRIKPKRIYIGSSVNVYKRWMQHAQTLKRNIHRSIKLQRHYNKYGEADLQYSILICCDKNDLIKMEQYFIDAYNPYFNCSPTASSRLGCKASEETKRKLRESHLGKSNPHIGQPRTDETKLKIGAASKGNKYALGYKHTDEAKRKISKASIGHTLSEESKAKISKSNKGRIRSDETRKKLGEIRKSQKGLKRGKYKSKVA